MKIDGERMKALRQERMLTQEEVAERAGVSHHTVVAAERGRSVSPRTARKVTEALGAKPKDLLPPKDHAPQQSGQPSEAPSEESEEVLSLATKQLKKMLEDDIQPGMPTDIASAMALLEKIQAEYEADRRDRSA